MVLQNFIWIRNPTVLVKRFTNQDLSLMWHILNYRYLNHNNSLTILFCKPLWHPTNFVSAQTKALNTFIFESSLVKIKSSRFLSARGIYLQSINAKVVYRNLDSFASLSTRVNISTGRCRRHELWPLLIWYIRESRQFVSEQIPNARLMTNIP